MSNSITLKQISDMLGISERHTKRLIKHDNFPDSIGEELLTRNRSRKLYPKQAVIEWGAWTGRYDPVAEKALKRPRAVGNRCECCLNDEEEQNE